MAYSCFECVDTNLAGDGDDSEMSIVESVSSRRSCHDQALSRLLGPERVVGPRRTLSPSQRFLKVWCKL